MTEVQHTTDRKLKWMRRAARIMAVIWAGGWTLLIAFWGYVFVAFYSTSLAIVAQYYFPVVLIGWVSAAIAWRREAIGGVVLVAEGLLGSTLVAWLELQRSLRLGRPMRGDVLLLFGHWALPPLVAGILFLVSWRRSRTSARRQDSAKERR